MAVASIENLEKDICQSIVDAANSSSKPITLTTGVGKKAILIGEDNWKAIEETLYLMSIPQMAKSITDGGKTPIEDCLTELNMMEQ